MRRAAKVDSTHGPIVEAFRKGGWSVLSLAPMGRGCPDLLVARESAGGKYAAVYLEAQRLHLIEVKSERGKLRTLQEQFGTRFHVNVLRSVEDAIEFMRTH